MKGRTSSNGLFERRSRLVHVLFTFGLAVVGGLGNYLGVLQMTRHFGIVGDLDLVTFHLFKVLMVLDLKEGEAAKERREEWSTCFVCNV